jgi:hypothetical protein
LRLPLQGGKLLAKASMIVAFHDTRTRERYTLIKEIPIGPHARDCFALFCS